MMNHWTNKIIAVDGLTTAEERFEEDALDDGFDSNTGIASPNLAVV
jgi:hypothetical protein